MPVVNYVKFMRGTELMYNALTEKDNNTLYFVYSSTSAEKGKLYLGNKLISGSSSIDGNISLSDIADVAINANVTDGDVLVYSAQLDQWVSMPISEAVGADVMGGATANMDGSIGLVPMPHMGDQNKFLRGDGTWGEVTGTISQEDLETINTLQDQVETLIGSDPNMSVAEIAIAEISTLLIPQDAQESLETLQEIGAWIQNHPEEAAQMNSDIGILQSDVADLDELLNGTQADPNSGLVARVESLEDSVGLFTPVEPKYLDIGSAITYLDNSITSLNTSVASINDRLRWHELSEE